MDLASPSVSREDTAAPISLTIDQAALPSIRLFFRRSASVISYLRKAENRPDPSQ
jgi:hypothetical protein